MKRVVFNVLYALMLVALPALTVGAIMVLTHRELVIPGLLHFSVFAGWLLLQGLLTLVLPGKTVQGTPLKDGRTLPYRTNGLAVMLATFALAAGVVGAGKVDAAWLYDQLVPMAVAANIIVLTFCVFLAVLSAPQASDEERKRNPLEKYVLGAALNPRTGNFDWKFFCESRPSMILWILIDVSCTYAQYRAFGSVSNGMWLVLAFQAFYVLDYFVLEEAILSTWDIQHESFGFLLGWGCLVWIPFTFSLQSVYLASAHDTLPIWAVLGLCVLNFTGYFIFRTSNLQKNGFRRSGSATIWGKPAEFIQTKRGTKLLVSGWWGIARHANYLGDLMMGLAWCLCTGRSHLLAYFYIIYFTILLVHREWRDGEHCAEKYGDDWKTYTARVRWRILPGVY